MLSLTFSYHEMKEFLLKTDKYLIENISISYSYHEYHNKVVEDTKKFEIVYPKEIPLENFIANKTYAQLLHWSISSVFERELKNKLLNL
jgi:hypothetical protein